MAPRFSPEDMVFVRSRTTKEISIVRGSSLMGRHSDSRRDHSEHRGSRHRRSHNTDSVYGSRNGSQSNYGGSVASENLHYPFKHKDVVCRCTDEIHNNRRSVKNFEIQELCKEFFQCNPDKIECRQHEWRQTLNLLTERQSTENSNTYNAAQPSNNPSDQFNLDSQSIYEMPSHLDPERKSTHSSSHSSRKTRHSSRSIHNGPNGEPDMPEQVFHEARSSMYTERHGMDSTASTPLGSTFGPEVHHADDFPDGKTSWPARANIMLRVPKPENWPTFGVKAQRASGSGYQRDSRGSQGTVRVDSCMVEPLRYNKHRSDTRASESTARTASFSVEPLRYNTVLRTPQGELPGDEYRSRRSSGASYRPPSRYSSELDSRPVHEMSGRGCAAELQATASRRAPRHDSRTLKDLVGGRLSRG